MSEFVVWFDSRETGAPVLNNAADSMIGVLDACLVTGFNTKAVSAISIAAGVATVTCTGHGYSAEYSKDVLIAGATPAGLNGRKQITVVDTNMFTFATSVTGAVTGTITARRDPLGWSKEFTGVNTAVYKRNDVAATSMRLQVTDPAGSAARVISVENPTDINTYTQKAPSETVVPGGYWWNKGENSVIGKHWLLVGDSRLFYLITQSFDWTFPSQEIARYASGVMAFGDLDSFKPGDAYHAFISGETENSGGGGWRTPLNCIFSPSGPTPMSPGGFTYARGYSQLGGPAFGSCYGLSRMGSGAPNSFVFPSPVDSGYVVSAQVLATELAPGGSTVRGLIPGVVEMLSYNSIEHRDIVGDLIGLPGRRIVGVRTHAGGAARGAFDITGPWR